MSTQRSALKDVVTREYTINLHKRVSYSIVVVGFAF